MVRSILVSAVVSCALLSGCVAEPEDDQAQTEAVTEEERLGTAQEALTWYCEGWQPDLYQYCLTRCEFNQKRMAVGSEDWVEYGQCQAKAEKFCQNHGWGAHYGMCWGYYY